MKICSLYGAGFYYIPGTDTCLKIGGWVRMQMGYGYNGNMTNGPMAADVTNRQTHDYMTRNRGYITADARSQTSMGTLRAYIAVGLSADNPLNGTTVSGTSAAGTAGVAGFSANRAFIQLGGWTAGLAQSFYDFMVYPAVSYNGGAIWTPAGADTGDGGKQVLAYTAQLGNGLSGTISIEDPRNGSVTNFTAAGVASTATSSNNFGASQAKAGNKIPDVVANLRVDQAWGGAQIMAALHDASAAYYDTALAGHPGNVYGYALGAGIRINAPSVGKGDYFQAQFNYSKGAIKYMSAGTSYSIVKGGSTSSGTFTDGVYGATGNVELTTGYSVGASYEHNWNPMWKTSLYGGYAKVDYSTAANAIRCTAAAVLTGCNGDFSTWQVGTRTAWAPVANLEVGVDVLYTKLNGQNTGTATTTSNADAWIGYLRIQRNFYP